MPINIRGIDREKMICGVTEATSFRRILLSLSFFDIKPEFLFSGILLNFGDCLKLILFLLMFFFWAIFYDLSVVSSFIIKV